MNTNQVSFSSGEFSPQLLARTDQQKYYTALATAKNVIVHPQGGVSNRPGTYIIASTKDGTKKSLLVPFRFSRSQSYVLEFGHLYCRFYTRDGQIILDKSNVSDFNPSLDYPVSKYIKVGAYIVCEGTSGRIIYISAPYGQVDATTIKVACQGNTSDTLSVVASGDTITIKTANTTTSKNAANLIQAAIRALGTVNGVSVDSWVVTANQPYGDSPSLIGLVVPATLLTACDKLYQSSQITSGSTNNTNYFPPVDTAYWTEVTEGIPIEIATPYTEDDLFQLEFTQSADYLYIVHPNYQPRTLIRNNSSDWYISLYGFTNGPFMNVNTNTNIKLTPSATSGTITVTSSIDVFDAKHVGSLWRIGGAVSGAYGYVQITAVNSARSAAATVKSTLSGTSATSVWAEGSWSDYRGWPSSITFYQDRLWFAATKTEPQTLWGSKLGDYINFIRSSPLIDTDGITTLLQSREINSILNIVDLGDLAVLTDDLNWEVGPVATGAPITPTSIKQKSREHKGSSGVPPVVVGSRAIYVQTCGTVVNDIGYDFEADGLIGGNISIFSDHLLKGHSIIQMAYQQEPDSIVWIVRDDGTLLTLTYNREQQIIAWTRCETQGFVESICTIPGDGYNELWMIVKRTNGRFVEKLANRMTSTAPEDQYFVDCGLSYDIPITITGISINTPVTITATAHGLSNGDLVDLSDIIWEETEEDNGDLVQPDQLNGKRYIVQNAAADTFEIINENGTPIDNSVFLPYVSGGKVRKAITTLSGLEHLETCKVAILANGFVEARQKVTGGSITLSTPASRVHVGLPYLSDVETLNIEAPSLGTIQAKQVRVPKVTFRFLNTRGGWAGPNKDQLTELIQRTNEPLGTPIQLFTGSKETTVDLGYETHGKVFFRQKDPLPFTILAIIPEVEIND